MAVHLTLLLILTGLTGIDSLATVNKVSVKAGDSISIPCLYGSKYINHVKYLCKGYYWSSCSYAIKTNGHNSEKFSISDDKSQRIFTVTIRDLTKDNTDYWCAVEINGRADVGKYFHLSVTRDTPSLYVDNQEITGFKGENTIINCNYHNSGENKWCRLGSTCVKRSNGSIDGTTVAISASLPDVFTVTMSGLRTESSGWYWCAKGDLQMPVNVTLNEQPTTSRTSRITTSLPTFEPVNLTPVFTDNEPTTVQGEQESVSVDRKKVIIPLSLLIFILMVTLFIWFMLKRHKQTKAASAAMKAAEEAVTYSTVEHKRKTSVQRSPAESNVDVTKVEAKEENVTYSTLA